MHQCSKNAKLGKIDENKETCVSTLVTLGVTLAYQTDTMARLVDPDIFLIGVKALLGDFGPRPSLHPHVLTLEASHRVCTQGVWQQKKYMTRTADITRVPLQ